MNNFYQIAAGVNVIPLMDALMRKPHLWGQNKFRTTFENTPHGDVDDIWLRYSEIKETDGREQVSNAAQSVWYPAIKELPQVRPLVRDLMHALSAYELGRVIITKLKPGGRILPHVDDKGDYVNMDDIARYHLVLQGLPGSLYRTGDETVTMRTGEVWWFKPDVEHEVINNSSDDRIHLLIDLRLM